MTKENLPSSRGTFVLDGGCPWKVSGDGLEQDRAVLLCLNLHLLISCKTPLMDKLQMVSLSPSMVRYNIETSFASECWTIKKGMESMKPT